MFTRVMPAALMLLFSLNALGTEYAVPPISLQAGKVLPAKQLQGGNFKVDMDVNNDGVINLYTLNTDYGRFPVESTAGLRIRIRTTP